MARGPITTHILDTARGVPAAGVSVVLEYRGEADTWRTLGTGATDIDGRIANLLPEDMVLLPGAYRLTFATGDYLAKTTSTPVFYPEIQIAFAITAEGTRQHYHIPLLLNPFGYTTYRGS